ncbi:MFS transporter [Gordonia sp. L191]|uniref:MFS transporter n=1 Tax=Gordonia sp. L191 TaxID=2982699 RepID=UPI0024BFDECF|nr:MFS transporter [Gordonia sp. L191]WHU48674.1 MFS transporter [Gordonia sp. L191]
MNSAGAVRIRRPAMKLPRRPEWVERSSRSHWYTIAGISFGAFMIQLDSSIVTLALPSLQRSFDASLASAQWVSVAYVLTVVALVAPCARLGDGWGRKNLYLYGYAMFTVGSILCSIAPDLASLIAFRVLQGTGGAAIAGNAIAMVTENIPKERLRDGLAVQAAVQSLGLALGPMSGGFLVDAFGWRSIFWVNVPIGVVAVVSALVLLPDATQRRSMPRFDWPGTTLLALAAIGLLVGLSGLSGLPLGLVGSLILLVSPALILPVFWRREKRAGAPLIDPPTLRTPQIAIGALGAMVSYLLLIAPTVLIPQLLVPLGWSVSATGVILFAMPAGFLTATVASTAWLHSWAGNSMRTDVGCVAILGAIVALASRPTEIAWIVPALAVLGIGLGVYVPANNASVMAAATARGTGTAGSLIALSRNVGVAIGVAVVTLTLHVAGHDSRRDASDPAGAAHNALVGAAHWAWLVLLGFAALAALAALASAVAAGRSASAAST